MAHDTAARPPVERTHPPHWLMRIVNPAARWMLLRGKPAKMAEQVLLLHFAGRRSGTRYSVPAGYRVIHGRMGVLTNSGWRVNFRGGYDFDVTLKGQRRPARGELAEDPGEVANLYGELLDEVGWKNARQLGIRINVGRPPTRSELQAMIERSGLSILWIDVKDTDEAPVPDETSTRYSSRPAGRQ